MSYRRDKQKSLEWSRWVDAHRELLLLSCGLPTSVFEEQQNWFHFLDHGFYGERRGQPAVIDVDGLSDQQAEALCSFLERQGDEVYVLGLLQSRLGRGRYVC